MAVVFSGALVVHLDALKLSEAGAKKLGLPQRLHQSLDNGVTPAFRLRDDHLDALDIIS